MQFNLVKSVLVTMALATFGGNAFADGWGPDKLVSKAPTGRPVVSECDLGSAMNGVFFAHKMGQDLTWQESFSALCIQLPLQKQVINNPMVKTATYPSATTQSAPAGGYLTGLGFSHNQGQDYTYQESVSSVGYSAPKPFRVTSNCRTVSSDRRQTELYLQCNSDEVVTSISFTHPYGQNYTYQETVSLSCCQFSDR